MIRCLFLVVLLCSNLRAQTSTGLITFSLPSPMPSRGNVWLPFDVDRTKLPASALDTEFLLWVQAENQPILARVGYFPLFTRSGRDSVLLRNWSQPTHRRYRFIAQTYFTVDYSDYFAVYDPLPTGVPVPFLRSGQEALRVYPSLGEGWFIAEVDAARSGVFTLKVVSILGLTLLEEEYRCEAGRNYYSVFLPLSTPKGQMLVVVGEYNRVPFSQHVIYIAE